MGLLGRISRAVEALVYRSRYLRWHVAFRRLNARHRRRLLPLYAGESCRSRLARKRVVCVMNGNFEAGGLADRLRTVVSVYQVCQELGLEFRLLFDSPFLLSQYLEPGVYDWTISADEVNFDSMTEVVCCEITDDTLYQSQRVHSLLRLRLGSSTADEIHVYGNPSFCYAEGTYATLFHQLFRLSSHLVSALEVERRKLGGDYFAVHLRFSRLLGDLDDLGSVLEPSRQQSLIDRCLECVACLQRRNRHQAMLLCSDSTRFVNAVRQCMPDVHLVDGEIGHIDYTRFEEGSDAFIKLFVEYFLMSGARSVYRVSVDGMRLSGLPLSASIIGGIKTTDITE